MKTVTIGKGRLAAALLAAFVAGALLRGCQGAHPKSATPSPGGNEGAVAEVWTCSMHPQIRLPGPGDCPICEMPLIVAAAAQTGAGGKPMLQLSDQALAMASVETTPVTRRTLTRELQAVGKIQYNESALATITARIDGYAEQLFVDFTGVTIKAGDHLAEIYSPELLVAQQELLIALRSGTGGAGEPLAEMARLKLQRWGLTKEQITVLVENNTITDRITLYSPIAGTVIEKTIIRNSAFKAGDVLYRIANLDTVWVYLDIYEFDLPWIRYGQKVEITAEALPGRTFEGLVTFVEPVVSEATRTVRVPVHVENEDQALKPGMFVSAVIKATLGADGQVAPTGIEGSYSCPMHPQILRDQTGACPICGMDLEQIPGLPPAVAQPVAQPGAHAEHTGTTTAPASVQYACPMDCEDGKAYDTPGKCPICGMDLEQIPGLPPAVAQPVAQPGAHAEHAGTTTAPASVQHACPMDCEDGKAYDTPGKCPVCNMKLQPLAAAAAATGDGLLAVPISAVLDSGTRRVVYVETARGLFEARDVVLGPRASGFYPVLQGVTEGERVVTRGGFLIDSQIQITGQPSLFYPGGLMGGQTGHQHGEADTPSADPPATMAPPDNTATPPGNADHTGPHQH